MTFMGHDPDTGLTIVIGTNLATVPTGEGSALTILKGLLPIFYPNMAVPGGDPAAAADERRWNRCHVGRFGAGDGHEHRLSAIDRTPTAPMLVEQKQHTEGLDRDGPGPLSHHITHAAAGSSGTFPASAPGSASSGSAHRGHSSAASVQQIARIWNDVSCRVNGATWS